MSSRDSRPATAAGIHGLQQGLRRSTRVKPAEERDQGGTANDGDQDSSPEAEFTQVTEAITTKNRKTASRGCSAKSGGNEWTDVTCFRAIATNCSERTTASNDHELRATGASVRIHDDDENTERITKTRRPRRFAAADFTTGPASELTATATTKSTKKTWRRRPRIQQLKTKTTINTKARER